MPLLINTYSLKLSRQNAWKSHLKQTFDIIEMFLTEETILQWQDSKYVLKSNCCNHSYSNNTSTCGTILSFTISNVLSLHNKLSYYCHQPQYM